MEIHGEPATTEEGNLVFIYYDLKDLLNSIKQYRFITDEKYCKEVDNLYDGYDKLFVATITGIRFQIIVGVANIMDYDSKVACINKLSNQFEQTKNKEFKKSIEKYHLIEAKYSKLYEYIKTARDKIYAHLDLKFNLRKVDKYYDYTLDSEILDELEKYINDILDLCVELSKIYNGDRLHLEMDRNFMINKGNN